MDNEQNKTSFMLVLANLEKNTNLNGDLKQILSSMLAVLNSYLPELDYSLLASRISTFTISEKKKFTDLEEFKYDVSKNEGRISDNYNNQLNALIQFVLEMMVVREKNLGIDGSTFAPLKRGNFQMIANLVIAEFSKKINMDIEMPENETYMDEHIYANLVNILTDNTVMYAVMNGNAQYMNTILEEYGLVDINQLAVNNYMTRDKVGKSSLPLIEEQIVKMTYTETRYKGKSADVLTNTVTTMSSTIIYDFNELKRIIGVVNASNRYANVSNNPNISNQKVV